jgi:hypothetical protein
MFFRRKKDDPEPSVTPPAPTFDLAARDERSRRQQFGITVAELVKRGIVPAEAELLGLSGDIECHACITAAGKIRLESGEEFDGPSAAAMAALNRGSWNGWTFWRVIMPDGTHPTLDALRQRQ